LTHWGTFYLGENKKLKLVMCDKFGEGFQLPGAVPQGQLKGVMVSFEEKGKEGYVLVKRHPVESRS